jgi:hypothetical protein
MYSCNVEQLSLILELGRILLFFLIGFSQGVSFYLLKFLMS